MISIQNVQRLAIGRFLRRMAAVVQLSMGQMIASHKEQLSWLEQVASGWWWPCCSNYAEMLAPLPHQGQHTLPPVFKASCRHAHWTQYCRSAIPPLSFHGKGEGDDKHCGESKAWYHCRFKSALMNTSSSKLFPLHPFNLELCLSSPTSHHHLSSSCVLLSSPCNAPGIVYICTLVLNFCFWFILSPETDESHIDDWNSGSTRLPEAL